MGIETKRHRTTKRMSYEQIDIPIGDPWQYVGNKVFDLVGVVPRSHSMAEKIRGDHVVAWLWSDTQSEKKAKVICNPLLRVQERHQPRFVSLMPGHG